MKILIKNMIRSEAAIWLLIIIIALCLTGCPSQHKEYDNRNKAIFSTSDLNRAWAQKDTLYIKKYVSFLRNPYLSDAEFYELVLELSDVTDFCFGNIDINDERWKRRSDYQRVRERENTVQVYKLYMKSCMFMKPTTWDKTLEIQEWYKEFYENDSVFVINNPNPVLEKINSLCR